VKGVAGTGGGGGVGRRERTGKNEEKKKIMMMMISSSTTPSSYPHFELSIATNDKQSLTPPSSSTPPSIPSLRRIGRRR
jgi:hypothetical protein